MQQHKRFGENFQKEKLIILMFNVIKLEVFDIPGGLK